MKNIIVTGTSRGIGLEVVLELARRGNRVLAISRSEVQEFKDIDGVASLQLDITQEDEVGRIADYIRENWSQVDVLIHNAGAIVNKAFAELTRLDFEYVYRVNVFAVASVTQVCLPFFKAGAHVLTISSMGGVQGTMKFPGLAAYSSSKGAVLILTELWAEEYKELGISFNALALGAVQTEMLAEAFPGYQAPLKPAEMAQYIADFSVKGNLYYNGKVLEVSSTTP